VKRPESGWQGTPSLSPWLISERCDGFEDIGGQNKGVEKVEELG
jgi:hypothetical protein